MQRGHIATPRITVAYSRLEERSLLWLVHMCQCCATPTQGLGGCMCGASSLTDVSAALLDDNGSAPPRLLLHLSHALPGLLVGVVCGIHCNLVLDGAQAVQLNSPVTAKGT